MHFPQDRIVRAVATSFYDVVPATYRTFCSLDARVLQRTFQAFGFEASLQPCQLWYAGPQRNHVVGFTGQAKQAGRWDGHVVCTMGEWLLDAAVEHLHVELGVKVPHLIATQRFPLRSQAIARWDLSENERLWWLHAPEGVDATPSAEPEPVVAGLAQALHARALSRLAQEDAAAPAPAPVPAPLTAFRSSPAAGRPAR